MRYHRKQKTRKQKNCLSCLVKIFVLLMVMTYMIKKVSAIVLDKTIDKEAKYRIEILEATGWDYPQDLLKLAEMNPEAMEFILNYPKKKDDDYANTVGHWEEGKIPFLLQWDERWGYAPYGSSMIAVTGCGPVCLSMVACGLTGDDTITPVMVAEFAEQNEYYENGAGTSWKLMTDGAETFGLRGEELSLSEKSVFSCLQNGMPIICSMRPGDFTTTGHFIVLTGIEDERICIHDPNSKIKSEKLWSYEVLAPQINNLWAFSLLHS